VAERHVTVHLAQQAAVERLIDGGEPLRQQIRHQAGLRAGAVTQRDANGTPRVLGQSIPVGTRVLRTTQVGFVVSRTPVVVRPDTPRTPAGAPVVDSAATPAQPLQPAQPQATTTPESVATQAPVVVQPIQPAVTQPAQPGEPGGVTAPSAGQGTTPRGQERQNPPVPWRWIVIAVAVLLAGAGALYLRFRPRPGPPAPDARPTPAPAPPVGAVVTVRARGGGSTVGRQPERPVEKGRVKIGMVVGAPRVPEPAAGAEALKPGQVIVRLVDGDDGDPLGAHPQRVTVGGEIHVRVAGTESALMAELEDGILKGS